MTEALSGLDIGKIMSEEGTVVKCVLLRCRPVKSEDDSNAEAVAGAKRPVSTMSVKELKAELRSHGVDVDASTFVEKDELIEAPEEARSSEAEEDSAAVTREGGGELPSSASAAPQSRESAVPLTHLISEISVDTTPKKSMVAAVLGGEFTFLGQYESEGVMVMVRRPDWDGVGVGVGVGLGRWASGIGRRALGIGRRVCWCGSVV